MSTKIIDGGPAFPEIRIRGGDNYNTPQKVYYPGMSLRDYFAAKAMQAIIIGNGADESALGTGAAKDAYAMADAMLKARKEDV